MQPRVSRGLQRPVHEGEAVSTRGGGTDLVPRELPAGGHPKAGAAGGVHPGETASGDLLSREVKTNRTC